MDIRGPSSRHSSQDEDTQGRNSVDRSYVGLSHIPHIPSLISIKSAQSLRELHARGGSREDIEGALKIMPFVSKIVCLHFD